jgi:hypothetical protein
MKTKLTQEEMNEVLEHTKVTHANYPYLRKGEAFYSTLFLLHPPVALNIEGTKHNPFYDDSRLEACIKYLTKA